jgi:hypothetical protein
LSARSAGDTSDSSRFGSPDADDLIFAICEGH